MFEFLDKHFGGIYFINHKTKDYFPECAGLLNLSWVFSRNKRVMTHNYFWVINITIKKIIIGNTHLVHDVLETSPEGSLKFLMSGTYGGPSGDSQRTNTKIDGFMKKNFFRSNSPCTTYLFLFFTGRKNIQKL